MYWSSFWVRGYAIHGYKSVPTHPASHGCVRTHLSEAKSIFDWVDDGPSGTTIYTYGIYRRMFFGHGTGAACKGVGLSVTLTKAQDTASGKCRC